MLNPVVIPELVVPADTIPVRDGANVTVAPGTGTKMLSGVADAYNCAVIVIISPIGANAAVVLKKALKEVIVPARGTEKAKLSNTS